MPKGSNFESLNFPALKELSFTSCPKTIIEAFMEIKVSNQKFSLLTCSIYKFAV